MKKTLFFLLALMLPMVIHAQRITDKLDRGLIAQKNAAGVFVSWRILGEEYYDVTYNVYRDGAKINEEPLTVSNFMDNGGTTSSSYTVAPVVKGKEQAQSKAVKPWSSSYTEIRLKHEGIASTLIPNDACCADVDGDGELEILMKFDNLSEMEQSYPKEGPTVSGKVTGEYSIFEVLKLDGTRLWWVNCGPNMGDFQNNEQNIVGYDWNQDGKAEVVMRLLEGSTIHYANGQTYTIGRDGKNGTSWYNYRAATGGGTNWFMHDGVEFLVYCNGQTGELYDIINYPLARLEPGETDLNAAWGDGYGHRCSKFFFGAPYLDGRKPSIFLARGIYTQIKMCAYDVNPSTNKLVKRWDWRQTAGGYWMWQGYHNFGVADVDMDGRDEICYGSMVIDDNGKGLSTTGLGHGDAQHCGDFNPFIHGLEIYACNEDQPGNNYRDATTSKIYHRFNAGNDDGRAMMDNFSDQWPGSIGCSAREGAISSVTNDAVPGMGATGINTNFRIYWDGDLCSETFNYLNGKNTEGVVAKYGSWNPIYIAEGSMTNNDTKGTPCYQGDILGDWREEIIMRTASNNIRIYSTPTPTEYRIPTLWADHQYRNAMVWQMCGYNQPPHVSYFLGNMEGITQAPPPLTMTGRSEVANGGTIGTNLNGKHAIVCETGNSSVTIAEGAQPDVLTFNVPSWVQGTAGTNYTAKDATINYVYYTCNVAGAGISGEGRLVKQGDGILNLPKADFTHTGNTDVWAGTVNFDGTMKNSDLWLNRFAELNSNGGQFKSIKANYAAIIRPGGKDKVGNITVNEKLLLDYGSRVVIDIDGTSCDKITAASLEIVKKTGDAWVKYGPEYIQPVIEINGKNMVAGDYVIAECPEMTGSITSLKVEGVVGFKSALKYEDGKLILTLGGTRGAAEVHWTGNTDGTWDYANTENVVVADDKTETPDVFVNGDLIEFNDDAKVFNISLVDNVTVDTLKVNNTKAYTISGDGSIKGGAYVKEGTGSVTISTKNSYTGGNYLKGGTTVVSLLANDISAVGNLGGVTSVYSKFTMENGAVLQTTAAVTNGSVMRMIGEQGGVINNNADFVQQKAINGTLLTKKGGGWLKTSVSNSALEKLVVVAGTVQNGTGMPAKLVELQGNSALVDNVGTSYRIMLADKANASWTLSNNSTYTNTLTGKGTVKVYLPGVKGTGWVATRTPFAPNLSAFEGTIEAHPNTDERFTFATSNGSDKWTLNIPAGILVQNESKALRIGTVTGTGDLSGSCTFSNNVTPGISTWNVGNATNFTFDGKVSSNAIFNKMGTGTMTVNGVWTTTGKITVKEGTLKLGTKDASLGTTTLQVDAAGTLQGQNATVKNSSVTINGTLFPSAISTSSTGSLLFNNQDVTIGETGTLKIVMRKTNTAATTIGGTGIKNVGKLTINGTIHITPNIGTYTVAVGDTYRMWTGVASFAGTPKIVVEPITCSDTTKPYYGGIIEFDQSRISEGLLVVKKINLRGDVDGDGAVTMADANMVVNKYLGTPVTNFNAILADMDGDGQITMSDANAIVNLYLGNQ